MCRACLAECLYSRDPFIYFLMSSERSGVGTARGRVSLSAWAEESGVVSPKGQGRQEGPTFQGLCNHQLNVYSDGS